LLLVGAGESLQRGVAGREEGDDLVVRGDGLGVDQLGGGLRCGGGRGGVGGTGEEGGGEQGDERETCDEAGGRLHGVPRKGPEVQRRALRLAGGPYVRAGLVLSGRRGGAHLGAVVERGGRGVVRSGDE